MISTPPPKLTDEQIDKIEPTKVWDSRRSYARAIETARDAAWAEKVAALYSAAKLVVDACYEKNQDQPTTLKNAVPFGVLCNLINVLNSQPPHSEEHAPVATVVSIGNDREPLAVIRYNRTINGHPPFNLGDKLYLAPFPPGEQE